MSELTCILFVFRRSLPLKSSVIIVFFCTEEEISCLLISSQQLVTDVSTESSSDVRRAKASFASRRLQLAGHRHNLIPARPADKRIKVFQLASTLPVVSSRFFRTISMRSSSIIISETLPSCNKPVFQSSGHPFVRAIYLLTITVGMVHEEASDSMCHTSSSSPSLNRPGMTPIC